MGALKTLIFSILVPGTVAGVIPWLLLRRSSGLALMIPSVWMIGEAILFRSFLLAAYALVLWGVFHAFVVFVEEPSLRRQCGTSYET